MKNEQPKESRFPPGNILETTGAIEVLNRFGANVLELLECHVSGDWGVVCAADALLNEEAVFSESRILSAYEIGPRKERVWIITEADRSATTILTPVEY
ncbi:hypothetical protein DBB29_19545 [Pandoraea cepalis]|uniref:Type I restriction endonuclease subunit M n=1 Tax=Pandoraea cepalis TaxID=2508294 RepID=A0AAW7MQR8_9BURK|nr:hypothetical protein [Pandoraea cepalis]MDN4574800.1 hypothetical protein [Pandoraea cepalis]MDN4580303.1 hypothetical protein [Pandoraea cepalis]